MINLKDRPLSQIFFEDIISAFYIFQAMCFITWVTSHYYLYSWLIFLMIFISLYGEWENAIKNSQVLKEFARYECSILVKRQNDMGESKISMINSKELVPGDVFLVKRNQILPWDAILLNGEVTINEAILTGSMLPVNKIGIPNSGILHLNSSFYGDEMVSSCL